MIGIGGTIKSSICIGGQWARRLAAVLAGEFGRGIDNERSGSSVQHSCIDLSTSVKASCVYTMLAIQSKVASMEMCEHIIAH